ncbi:MAG: TetR family transcriptional regulator [Clostridia bacterium]|nr:TetR family transcriptional regulator [Clostridia bacterium]
MAKVPQEMIYDEMSETIIETAEKLAVSQGADNTNVRAVLRELGITNRVFYNRFHNMEEVLGIIYERTILKIRKSITERFNPDGDFFLFFIDIVANTLIMSYQNKMNFNLYVFANDSLSEENFVWWSAEIKRLIEFGIAKGYLRKIDSDIMSYAIWCFIRGYNADAIGRGLDMEEAEDHFRYCFRVLLDGMKA